MQKARFLIIVAVVFLIHPVFAQQKRMVSVDGLIYDLKHPEPERRKDAALVLGQNKVRQAVPGLIELTGDADDAIRLEAVRALVRINDTRALPTYIRLTQDPSKAIQEKSIEGIINRYVTDEGGFISGIRKFADIVNPWSDDYNPLVVEPYVSVSPEAVSAVAALLTSNDTGLRRDAAVALGILRASSALPQIQEALARETKDSVTVELIRAIYKIGDREAANSVVPFIKDPDKRVHDEAIFTVGRLRVAKAVPHLRELYESGIEESKKILGLVPITGKDDLAKKLYEAMSFIGDPSCKDLMLAGLADDRLYYRRYGAEGIGRIGDRNDVTLIATNYLREKESEAKLAMSFALYRLGRDEHLLELARGGDQGLNYLLELEEQEIQKLYPYLESEKDSVKARLLEVIGLRGDQTALPVAERYMNHKNADVVSAANLAVRRLRARVTS
ncbi:MAG TPA: HEAT repeat domain-containing protein [Acidobacteriota bacterium]|nr:HEAT repeat domain-containing protein [Acidobacteriota bacterium]